MDRNIAKMYIDGLTPDAYSRTGLNVTKYARGKRRGGSKRMMKKAGARRKKGEKKPPKMRPSSWSVKAHTRNRRGRVLRNRTIPT